MWRELESDAIFIGLDLNYFWNLNPKQYAKHLEVFNKKEIQRLKEIDTFNFMLGKYVAFAFNDPKHYPSKPFTDKTTQLEPTTGLSFHFLVRHRL